MLVERLERALTLAGRLLDPVELVDAGAGLAAVVDAEVVWLAVDVVVGGGSPATVAEGETTAGLTDPEELMTIGVTVEDGVLWWLTACRARFPA